MQATGETYELLVLGTGAGVTKALHNEPPSSYIILRGGRAVLMVDMGGGAAFAALQHHGSVPRHVYVSHNHTDHAGDLPVVAATMSQRGTPLHVYAAPDVTERLRTHRMHEHASSVDPVVVRWMTLPTAASWEDLGQRLELPDIGLSVLAVRSCHSEVCYGLAVFDAATGLPVVGFTADSGLNKHPGRPDAHELLHRLFSAPEHAHAKALIVADARATGSYEHASFDEIRAWAASVRAVARVPTDSVRVAVSGYGTRAQAPDGATAAALRDAGVRVLVPGETVALQE